MPGDKLRSLIRCRSASVPGGNQVDGLPPAPSVAGSLHAKFYLYELNFLPSGVSAATLSVEDTLGQSIFSGP